MSKKFIYIPLLFITILLSGCSIDKSLLENNIDNPLSSLESDQKADKLQIYYFHRTQRCSTCRAIGAYSREVVEVGFKNQVDDGLIEFREVNLDLPENKELALKFQAAGQSLYINAIKDGRDNIAADMNVWRLVRSESQFKEYLKGRINNLLGI